MLKLRTFITSAFVAFAAVAFAQTPEAKENCGAPCPEEQQCQNNPSACKKFVPYYFVSLQAGGTTTIAGGNDFCDAVSPAYGVSVGGMFTKVIGARVNVTGYTANNYLKSVEQYYKYNYIDSNVDVLLNIYQLAAKNANPYFNVFMVAGVGVNYAWNNDELGELQNRYGMGIREDLSNAWGTGGSKRKSVLSHSFRAGLMLDFKVSRKINIGFEGLVHNFNDRVNSLKSDCSDWSVSGAGYVSYKFGYKKPCKKECPNKK